MYSFGILACFLSSPPDTLSYCPGVQCTVPARSLLARSACALRRGSRAVARRVMLMKMAPRRGLVVLLWSAESMPPTAAPTKSTR